MTTPPVLGVIRQRVDHAVQGFLRELDRESISNFQVMYYYFIITAGIYLLTAVSIPPQALEETLGGGTYNIWLLFNIICPILTLIGRRLTRKAADLPPGKPNPGAGAAWLQLTGDAGVWGAICIYVACVFNTSWWGQGLYAVFFVAMGVPGGFMFTLQKRPETFTDPSTRKGET